MNQTQRAAFLTVAADTLYFLDSLDESRLQAIVTSIGRALAPGGLCLVANHYFSRATGTSGCSAASTRRSRARPAWS